MNEIKTLFQKTYGYADGIRTFFSPGRVNLIGEHIDYNGGYVFPCALSLGNYGAIALRDDRIIRFFSANFEKSGIVEFSLDNLEFDPEHGWTNYPKGVIRELRLQGNTIERGFDMVISGDLPNRSGLSSSASIEMLMAEAVNELFQLHQSAPNLAVLCKKVENEFIGVSCGIMDQFVIACGKKDHALLLNCTTLEYTQVPLILGDFEIVICNSKVKRGLVDSKYNERRSECFAALDYFKQHVSIKELCDLNLEQFEQWAPGLANDTLLRRARHAVTENLRTKNAYTQLTKNDLMAFGKAMIASHRSLQSDYEVSCPELDALVEIALQNGSIGSRMTGAGFGGCTVNLVKKSDRQRFQNAIISEYRKQFGIEAEVYVAKPWDGTKEIQSF